MYFRFHTKTSVSHFPKTQLFSPSDPFREGPDPHCRKPSFSVHCESTHTSMRVFVLRVLGPRVTCLLFRLLGGYLCSSNFPKRHLFLSFRASAGLYFRFHAGTSVSHFRKQGFSVPRTFWENICVLQIFRKESDVVYWYSIQ